MTPERWRQVTALFHAARARDTNDQRALLDDACAGDAALRAEVEQLLAADSSGATGPSLEIAPLPQLSPGTTFGAYRVEALVGAGGMGQVYRASDTRLRRSVALKVLLPELALDPDFGARFEREAHVLASLTHPNIAAIYGVEEAGGVQALVLEFVEGVTLADRLRMGPLPVPEALAIARQIASALEAAHERGIVHRDLKPANIKIAPNGIAKVLDFGIARVAADAQRRTVADTRTGLVIGTPAYMSPEQARGLAVDKRTDVWAFGCVLFEMLTGKGAFAADTASDSLARVIERDPDWTAVPTNTPEMIRRLVRRSLQKDPANRLHDIADGRIEIEEALSSSARVEPAHAPERSHSGLIAILAIALLAALMALLWRPLFRPTSAPPRGQATEFSITFPITAMQTAGMAVSPDGRHIVANVFSGSGNLWIASLDGSQLQPRPLPGGENGGAPFWSPDGSTLAFIRNSGPSLVATSATGGDARVLATFEGPTAGGTWSRDNVILISAGGKIVRIPASGGSAPVQVPLDRVKGQPVGPVFLPDGRHFVFCDDRQVSGSMYVGSLDDRTTIELGESDCPGGFAPPDYVFFLRRGSLLAQKIDLQRFALVGDPQVVASGLVRGSLGPWPVLRPSASDASAGVLAFPAPRGGSSLGQLIWFDRSGKPIGTPITPLASEIDAEFLNPAICPSNEHLVAVNRVDLQTATWHVWTVDTSRNNALSRLTANSGFDRDLVWSPDCREIAFASDRSGDLAFYRQAISSGNAELLPLDISPEAFPGIDAHNPVPYDWSRDGHILFSQLNLGVWAALLSDRASRQLGEPRRAAYGPRLSPDGKWLAYGAVPSQGRFEVFVERFPEGSPRKQITTNGGAHPRWTHTAKGVELVYWAVPRGIESTVLSLSDQDIQVGETTMLVPDVAGLIDLRTAYDITSDGQKILAREQAGPPSPGIRVIVNWTAKLK
jgi:serine/threonine protein kinase